MKNSLLHHAPSYLATVAALLTLVFAMTTPLTPFMAFIGIPLLLLSIAATGLLAQQRLGRCRDARSAKAARRAPENPRGIRHPLQPRDPLIKSGRSRLVSEMRGFEAQIAGNSELLPRFATKKPRISGPIGEFMT